MAEETPLYNATPNLCYALNLDTRIEPWVCHGTHEVARFGTPTLNYVILSLFILQ